MDENLRVIIGTVVSLGFMILFPVFLCILLFKLSYNPKFLKRLEKLEDYMKKHKKKVHIVEYAVVAILLLTLIAFLVDVIILAIH